MIYSLNNWIIKYKYCDVRELGYFREEGHYEILSKFCHSKFRRVKPSVDVCM